MDQIKTKIRSFSTFRIVVITFMVTVILAFVAWYLFIFEKQIKIVPPVEMAEVKVGNLELVIVSEGELRPSKSIPVMVPESLFGDFSVPEIEISSLLPEYSKVEKGEIIAQLDPAVFDKVKSGLESEISDLENKIREIPQDSIKQLKDVKLALENARIDLEIRKIAVEQSLFDPASAHERMKLEFSKSELAYQNALANYRERKKSLEEKYASYPERLEKIESVEKPKLPTLRETLKIESPIKGILTYVYDAKGEKISAGSRLSPGNRIVAQIEDIGRLISQFNLSEEYFSQIKEGQAIDIYLKTNAIQIVSKISTISQRIETVNGKKVFSVEAVIENPGYNLLPGQTTENKISLNILENVMFLPNSSIHEDGEKSYVFLNGGIRHEVKSRRVNEEYTQIISGLSEGQLVYLNAIAAVSK